jgi:hypothetical protein
MSLCAWPGSWSLKQWDWMSSSRVWKFVFPQNSYAEILNTSMMVLGHGTFGRWGGLCPHKEPLQKRAQRAS